ncbi:MAG TPA: hypothetical protein VMX97_16580 [Hyphomicrobiaceae bacterium]|nr:hypothetical protein [Hyphomicrobiaceae bacterium]
MTATETVARYADLRASGLSISAATSGLRLEGVSFNDACDASWKYETGKPEAHDTRARRNWDKGLLARNGIS